MKKESAKVIVSVGWYTPVEWSLLKAHSVDTDKLDDTYEAWLTNAGNVIKRMEASGISVVRVPIRIAELQQWCAQQGLPLDGDARARYASERASGGHCIDG
ncbi:MAG: hypothetical protein K0Q55_3776 [Verrucomicrobia bacterium]|jgi:hypothetical protein|nr:hypothetical protein [Verrucomicrobiota bacterium]